MVSRIWRLLTLLQAYSLLVVTFSKNFMASILFNNVCIDFPIFNAHSRSLKNRIMQVATGGQLNADDRGRITVRALENINFTFSDGERIALLGHNGAGKSTLLRALGKIYQPSSGLIKIEGSIGSLIDISLGIDTEATGRENIFLRGGMLGLSKDQLNRQLNEIIEFSELGDFIDMPLRTYSTGMNMRLAFAISTTLRPNILIMDEWLSVGDEKFKHKAESRMKSLVDATNILVVASHSRDLILNTCNRVIWLEHGKIIMDGDPKSILPLYFDEK
jgi:lipopolysaccharide transport system ATP-binding protein